MNKKDFNFEIKNFDAEKGTFSGYGNVFNFTDHAQDNTQKGAFTKTLQQHKANGTMPALLWQHKHDMPIGVYTDMYEDEHGLVVKGELNLETQAGREAHALLKQGAIKGLSIGYITESEQWNSQKGYNELKQVNLLECSLVTFPCNAISNVETVKSLFDVNELPSERQLEKALRELGFSRKQSKAFIAEGFKALTDKDEEVQECKNETQDVQETEEAVTEQVEEKEVEVVVDEVELKRSADLLARLRK